MTLLSSHFSNNRLLLRTFLSRLTHPRMLYCSALSPSIWRLAADWNSVLFFFHATCFQLGLLSSPCLSLFMFASLAHTRLRHVPSYVSSVASGSSVPWVLMPLAAGHVTPTPLLKKKKDLVGTWASREVSMWVFEEDRACHLSQVVQWSWRVFVSSMLPRRREEKGGWGTDLASSEDMLQAGIQMECSRSNSRGWERVGRLAG